MTATSIDLVAFYEATTESLGHIRAIRALLAPFVETLSTEERLSAVKAPHKLGDAARASLDAAKDYPEIAAAAKGFDPALISTRLACIEELAPLANQAEALNQLITDARLLFSSEAYQSILSLYRVTKEIAKGDPDLNMVIKPIRDLYVASGDPKGKDSKKSKESLKNKPSEGGSEAADS